tara:strand:- start:166 stop:468 length:303 start_codon:yes stop_codon:yes gene_type:complete
VGTERLASMFVTTRPAAPRSTSGSTTDASVLSSDGGVAASGEGVDAGVEAGVDGAGEVVCVEVVCVDVVCLDVLCSGAVGAGAAAAAACGTAAGEYSTGA